MIVLSNDTTYPIFTNFLKFDMATRSLTPDPKLFYELRFGAGGCRLPADLGGGPFLPGDDPGTRSTSPT